MSYQYDLDLSADERVKAFVFRDFHARGDLRPEAVHLRTCPEVTVKHVEGNDGEYGCDTGCEYARLEAVISCVHGYSCEHEYGDFGELADILEKL